MAEEQHIKLSEEAIEKETTTINVESTHPATHGVFQNIMEIDGERVLRTEPTIGYIHRAFEKIAERRRLLSDYPFNRPVELLFRSHQ